MTRNAVSVMSPVTSAAQGTRVSLRAPVQKWTILIKRRANVWAATGTGRIAEAAARTGSGTAEMRLAVIRGTSGIRKC
jgi:hypothetical protein